MPSSGRSCMTPWQRLGCAASRRAWTRTEEWSFFLSADGGVVAPAPTPAACELFGATLPQAQAYAKLLAGPGVERGLIGPDEAERIWDRHLVNSGLVAELLPGAGGGAEDMAEARPIPLAALGPGAGLPGTVPSGRSRACHQGCFCGKGARSGAASSEAARCCGC